MGGAGLLVLLLARPMLLTNSAPGGDWLKHLWQVWQQAIALRDDHAPTLFLNAPKTAFYPFFAFYGGTLYVLTATLSLALGNSPHTTYVLTYLAGFAAAYGGWYWLARMAGLGRWPALAPGTVFITSHYYLALVYGRGDWPEFIGVSTIPLLIAAGCEVLFAKRLRLLPAVALAAGSIMFFGSHTLTTLWGSTLIVLLGTAFTIALPGVRARITRRGLWRVAGIVAPSILINAWFLLPAVAYQAHTNTASKAPIWHRLAETTVGIVSAAHLFALSPVPPTPTPSLPLAVGLPVPVILWLCVCIAVLLRRRSRDDWTRTLLILAATTLVVGILMTQVGLLLVLPHPYTLIQFTYRLESYVLLGISGSLLAGLVAIGKHPGRIRAWHWALLPALLLLVFGAVQQVGASPQSGKARLPDLAKLDPEYGDYINVNLPFIAEATSLPAVSFPPRAISANRISLPVRFHDGQHVDTNLLTYTNLIHITGASILGYGPRGELVLEIGPSPATPHTISVSPADPWPVSLGRLLAIGGILALIFRLSAVALTSRRREPRSTGA